MYPNNPEDDITSYAQPSPWKIWLYSAISHVHLSRSPNWLCEIFEMFQWKSSQNKWFLWLDQNVDVLRCFQKQVFKDWLRSNDGLHWSSSRAQLVGTLKREKKNSTCKNLPCLYLMPWIMKIMNEFSSKMVIFFHRRLLRSGPFALYDEGWTMDATMCVPNLRRKRICQDLFAAPQRSRSDRYVANRWKCRVQLRWISSEEVWTLSLSIRSETQRDPPIYIVI